MMNQKMVALGEKRSTIRELFEFGKVLKTQVGDDNVYDFSIGNPSIPCPDSVTETLLRLLKTEDPVKLHSYTSSAGDPGTRAAIAEHLNKTYQAGTCAEDIYMTCGAAASLTVSLHAVAGPGEEVIVFTPCFPEYFVFIEKTGAKPVPVLLDTNNGFQIDMKALEEAFTERTAAVIINSPNNPTGAILTEESIRALSDFLRAKEEAYGKEIYLISDEPYRELNYSGSPVPFVSNFYEDTMVCYSYSKSLSLPGERIGYIMVSPSAHSRKKLNAAVGGSGRSLGFVCAPSLWQLLVKENQGVTSDVSIYKNNRDLLSNALVSYGYEVVKPDGAFYLFVKSPNGDGQVFCEEAKKKHILIVPSDDFGVRGYARISYCVDSEMIKRSLPAFKDLYDALMA